MKASGSRGWLVCQRFASKKSPLVKQTGGDILFPLTVNSCLMRLLTQIENNLTRIYKQTILNPRCEGQHYENRLGLTT